MRQQWVAVLGCLCLAGAALSAVVPTPDTMVVTRVDDGVSQSPSTEVTAITEKSIPEIKLTDMEVTSNIALRYANTAVVTSVKNPAKVAQEATFRVLLPETAFISGFTMTLDGKSYKAYVKEKEEAKQIYNDAVSQGLGAAHIATKARDSNHFTVSVNVEPNSVAIFNLTYEELLVRRHNVYNHAINLHPGALVPKLTVTVNIKEQQKITTLRVPEIRTGNEIDATEDDAQSSSAVIERSNNDHEVKVVFKPTLEEQERLISIYREKTKETRKPSYYYGYNPYEDNEDEKEKEGVLGQFVVQYDVERPKDGEILVNDGYFVHFFAPSDLKPLNKHVVFVLDTSGSMIDRKIVQLREAMQTILGELNRGDYFSIVEFSTGVKVHELNEADEEPQHNGYYYNGDQGTKLVPPSQASTDNIAKAKILISRLQASGGTNIYTALDVAVALTKKGVNWTGSAKHYPKTASVEVTTETATAVVASNDTNRPEPIIIFLTDGDPTVGVVDTPRIISHISEANTGEHRASLFSLAFGEDADRKFLRKLSLKNDGFMRHIYEAADAALQLRAFYRQVASPLLADVKFIYPKKQIKEGSVTKHKFQRFYAGSETVVAGRLADDATELTPQVQGFCGVDDLNSRVPYEILPIAPVPAKKDSKFLPLERLWAYLTIKQLLDEKDAIDAPNDKEDPKSLYRKALDIALKYEFVTPLTSLVVVKPNASAAVDAESVDKQAGPAGYAGGAGASFASAGVPLAGPLPVYAPAAIGGRPGSMSFFSQAAAAPQLVNFALAGPPAPMYQSEDTADYVSEDRDEGFGPGSFQPLQFDSGNFITSTYKSVMTTTVPDYLSEYHLDSFLWLRPLLGADGKFELLNGTNSVTYEVTKDTVPKPSDGMDPDCPVAIDGKAGVCVYLTRCPDAAHLSVPRYSDTSCLVNDKYAGVCCPKAKVDLAQSATST